MPVLITLLYGFAALFGAAFALIELRMLARFLKHRSAIRASEQRLGNGKPPSGGGPPPTVTIQIPLYNERTSAEQIIRAAAAQEYPRNRFDIQVLDDSTDETSEIVARVTTELHGTGIAIEHLRREDRAGYKAGAMAAGLDRSDSEFVAVFDADFSPETGFLQTLLCDSGAFDDPRVAFVQTRWAWGAAPSDGWLPATLGLLLDRHFRVQKPLRAFIGNVTTFNGSGGIWRRDAIDDAGGWTSDTLTEDLDLSYRCALLGWRGRYLHDVKVLNELPGHMRSFKLQQRRWSKGSAQCFRKLMRRVMGSKDVVEDRWDEAFMLAGYAIHPLLFASLLLWPWAVLYVDRLTFWILQAFMALGIIAAALSMLVTVHERDGRWSARGIREIVLGLCIGMGLMVNNTVGQIQGLLTSGGEFVRTPKRARVAQGVSTGADAAERPYATKLHWTFFIELLVLAYCVAGAVFLVQSGEALWAIAMVFWAACMALMLQQQLTRRPG